jgi:hypothetical protein
MISTRSFASAISAAVVTSARRRLISMPGVGLTKFLSHVDTSHHLNLVCCGDCPDDFCILFDSWCALSPQGQTHIMKAKLEDSLPVPQ